MPTTQELAQMASERPDGSTSWDPPVPTEEELAWRHGKWQPTRTLIRESIQRTTMNYKRLGRWDSCGACAVVEHSKEADRYRVTCWHCHDRLCEPCQKRRVAELSTLIKRGIGKEQARFVTLTLAHRDEPLKDNVNRLRSCFNNLRKGKWWKKHVNGGVAVLEVKKNPLGPYQNKKGQWRIGDGKWHSHFHIVCTGSFMPQAELSNAWHEATGDSWIVDVRTVENPDKASYYMSKYVSKPCTGTLLEFPEKLDEFVAAIAGKRTFQPFGNWFKIDRTPDDDMPKDWKCVATVRELIQARNRGEQWAIGLTQALTEKPTTPKNDDPQDMERDFGPDNEDLS